LNKNIENLELKIGNEIVDKYEVTRMGNYEIYQKILEQISSIIMESAENLIADFNRRINIDLIYLKQEMLNHSHILKELQDLVNSSPQRNHLKTLIKM
jgi:hypothetical protein